MNPKTAKSPSKSSPTTARRPSSGLDTKPPPIDARLLARQVFEAAVESVKPAQLMRKAVCDAGTELQIGGHIIDYSTSKLFVIGAGKASGSMALTLEELLGDRISAGVVVVKHGHGAHCRRIEIIEAAHPYPDAAGFAATEKILHICSEAGEQDVVICLLSGGGSALLADCPPGVSQEEWTRFSKLLVNSGATIEEINAVRKHCSAVKGGQLAQIAWPARFLCLAISDVPGDRLDVIASGPAVADPSTFQEALDVLRRYRLEQKTPAAVLRHLERGYAGEVPETPKPCDASLARAVSLIIGNNRMALEGASTFSCRNGIATRIVTDSLQGDVIEAAELIARTARAAKAEMIPRQICCLLFGGETTIRVARDAKGGRCQHLALTLAKLLQGEQGVTILAAGTDGTDGPTEAAGAIIDGETWEAALTSGCDPDRYLQEFNSFAFLERFGGHVITGPTMTNVMDVIVAVLKL